jgi:uncharacterized LabA/DUF88 family protein
MSKAIVQIDGAYFNNVLEKVFKRPAFSYEKFSDILCSNAGCERVRTYYYHCMPYQSDPPTETERKRYSRMDAFMAHLRKLPRFEIRLGRLQKIGNAFKQKGVDIWFSVDLCKLSCKGAIDKAILVTGDSDFVPAVNVAKEEGVVTILYYSKTPPMYVHNQLLDACDEKYEITKDLIVMSKP